MSDICVIMNDLKKEINKNIEGLDFFYAGAKQAGLWYYLSKIQQGKYVLLTCNRKVEAKNIKIRNIFNWLSFQITSDINIDSFKDQSGGVLDGPLPCHSLPYFVENKSILKYESQFAKNNNENIHKYTNELFTVYVKPKSENCSMQSQAALSTLMNTFDYHPTVIDLTSCNILPPPETST